MQQARSNRSVLMLLQLVILVHMYLDKLCGSSPWQYLSHMAMHGVVVCITCHRFQRMKGGLPQTAAFS